jgi:hypothetical protein
MKIVFSLLLSLVLGVSLAQITYEVGDYSAIEVFDQLNVKLIPSDKNEIQIMGSKADKVDFINKNNTLKLRMDVTEFLRGDRTSVTVYFKKLNSVRASEGAVVFADELINASSLSLNAKEGASIELEINSIKLDAKSTSAGTIKVAGNADTQDVVCNAGGIYEAAELKTKISNVTVNAGGNAQVNATDFVNAKTRMGGNIDIYGTAEVNQSNFAGGNINIH